MPRLIHWRSAFVFTLPYCRACYVAGERGEIGRIGLAAAVALGQPAGGMSGRMGYRFWLKVRSLGKAHYAREHPEHVGRFNWAVSYPGVAA